MLSITAVPYEDVKFYLSMNQQPLPYTKEAVYQDAEDLIYSGQALHAPPAIDDFIIANNLLASNITFPTYNASSILLSADADLIDLSESLLLTEVDKERIIRILGYLNVLNNDMNVFDQLPLDIWRNIIYYISCKDLLLICDLSSKFSVFCQDNLETLLRETLTRTTGLMTNTYNKQQLMNLCKMVSPAKTISAGDEHSLILKNGHVYTCGSNLYGKLGLGDDDDRY